MKYFLFLASIFISICACASQENKLSFVEQLQWKNRVLIIWANQPKTQFNNFIENYQIEIDDRDMILFVIGPSLQLFTNYPGNIDANFVTSLKSKFPEQKQGFFLIGKDGGIKSNGKKLNILQIFAEINLMPMRKHELRNCC
jgi:hypothetical protein